MQDKQQDNEPMVIDPYKLQVASLLGDDFDFSSVTPEQLNDLEERLRAVDASYDVARAREQDELPSSS